MTMNEQEIIELLKTDNPQKLFASADKVRKEHVGDEIHLRAIIEFSNYCKQNCLYCGLRGKNKKMYRYRLLPDQIIELAKKAKDSGYQTIVLQSGEDNFYTTEMLVKIISEIKKLDFAITLSIGEKTENEYKAYKDAGADRYLLRIETTDEALYAKLDPGMSLANRKNCIATLKKLGYETGSGILVGLPGQTIESIAKDILYLQSIPVDMAGIGPFIYNPDTPIYDNVKSGKWKVESTFELSLKVMAILRLLMPDINIPATTAMETLNPNGRILALQAGANVIMPNVTEREHKKLYEIYPGKITVSETPLNTILSQITSIGRTVSKTKGTSKSIDIKSI